MPSESSSHPDDEMVESYAMNRLPENQLASFEEHLLLCERCRKRLQLIDGFVQGMRRGAKKLSE